MLVYGRDTVLQVVHNRGHGFQKVLTRPGCTNSNTHTINLGKTKSKPNEAFTTKQSQDSEIFQGATPLSYPQRSKQAPRWTQGLGIRLWSTGNPQTGTVDTAKSCPDPKQYRCYLSHNLNKT